MLMSCITQMTGSRIVQTVSRCLAFYNLFLAVRPLVALLATLRMFLALLSRPTTVRLSPDLATRPSSYGTLLVSANTPSRQETL